MNGIIRAYMVRLRASIRSTIVYSVAYGVGIIALSVIVGVLYPGIYTPMTRHALEVLAVRMLGAHEGTVSESILGVVAAAVYSPFLAALIAAFVASGAISSLFTEDRGEGVFEVLLAAPVTKRDIVLSLLVYTLLVSLLVEAAVMATASGVSLLSLYFLGYLSSLGSYYIKLSVLLVPSLTLPAALISLLLTIVAPSLGSVRTGLAPGQNVLATISLLPALVPFLVLNINPQIDPGELAFYTFILLVIITFILLLFLPRVLKEETLLR